MQKRKSLYRFELIQIKHNFAHEQKLDTALTASSAMWVGRLLEKSPMAPRVKVSSILFGETLSKALTASWSRDQCMLINQFAHNNKKIIQDTRVGAGCSDKRGERGRNCWRERERTFKNL